jgi:hypothetical protein
LDAEELRLEQEEELLTKMESQLDALREKLELYKRISLIF